MSSTLVDLEGAGTTQTLADRLLRQQLHHATRLFKLGRPCNVGGAPADVDTDLDGVTNGVEYFMNAAAGFTANPPVAVTAGPTRTVTWPNGGNIASSAYGTQFVVQTSTNLVTLDAVCRRRYGNLSQHAQVRSPTPCPPARASSSSAWL